MAAGPKVIGKVSIKVWPDLKGFREELRSKVTAAAESVEKGLRKIKVDVRFDSRQIVASFKREMAVAQKQIKALGPLRLPIETQLEGARKLASQAASAVRAADAAAGDINVGVNFDEDDLAKSLRAAANLANREAAAAHNMWMNAVGETERTEAAKLVKEAERAAAMAESQARRAERVRDMALAKERREAAELAKEVEKQAKAEEDARKKRLREEAAYTRQLAANQKLIKQAAETRAKLLQMEAAQLDKEQDANNKLREEEQQRIRRLGFLDREDQKVAKNLIRRRREMAREIREISRIEADYAKDSQRLREQEAESIQRVVELRRQLDKHQIKARKSDFDRSEIARIRAEADAAEAAARNFSWDRDAADLLRKQAEERRTHLIEERNELKVHYKNLMKDRHAHEKRMAMLNKTVRGAGLLTRRGGGIAGDALSRLSGIRLARNFAKDTIEPLTNFDIHLPKLVMGASAVTLLASAVGSLSGHLLTLGRDIARILPGAVALPGAFMAAGAGIATMVIGLRDMNKVAPEIGKAWKSFMPSVSGAFWSKSRTDISKSLVALAAPVRTGMMTVAQSSGRFIADMLKATTKIVGPSLKTMFDNTASGFKELSKGTTGFAKVFKELGLVGSKAFIGMSKSLADMGNQFGNFLERAREDGSMDRWVSNSIKALRDLGQVGKGVYRVLDQISAAAERAGGMSLERLGKSLNDMADSLSEPKVQKTIEQLFGGAYGTMESFFDGLLPGAGKLVTAFAPIAEIFGRNIGGTAGGLIGDFLEGLSSPGMMRSVRQFSEEIAKLGDIIGPVLFQSGEVAGILDTINAAIVPFGSVAAGAVGGVLSAIDDLAPSLVRAIEGLGEGAGDLMLAVFAPVTDAVVALGPLVEKAGGILGRFASRISPEIETGLSGLVPMVEGFTDGALAILDPLAEGLATMFEGAGEPLARVLESAGDAFEEFGRLAGAALERIHWEQFPSFLDRTAGELADLADGFRELRQLLDEGEITDNDTQLLRRLERFRDETSKTGFWDGVLGKDIGQIMFDMSQLSGFVESGSPYRTKLNAAGEAELKRLQELRDRGGLDPIEINGNADPLKAEAERAQAYIDSIKQLQPVQITANMEGMLSSLVSSAPAISNYLKDAFGTGVADQYSAALSSAMGKASEAIEKYKAAVDTSKMSTSEAMNHMMSKGAEAEASLRGSMQELSKSLKDAGVSYEDLASYIASTDLTPGERAGLEILLEQLGEFESQSETVRSAHAQTRSMLETPIKMPPLPELPKSSIPGLPVAPAKPVEYPVQVTPQPKMDPRLFNQIPEQIRSAAVVATPAQTQIPITLAPSPVTINQNGIALALAALQDAFRLPTGIINIPITLAAFPVTVDTASVSVGVGALQTAFNGIPPVTASANAALGTVPAAIANVASAAVLHGGTIRSQAALSATSVQQMAGNFSTASSSAVSALTTVSTGAVRMATAVSQQANNAVASIRSMGGRMNGSLSNVSLYSQGSRIGQSLINGIRSKYGALVSTLRSMTAAIPANKGPIEVDRKLLTPNGMAIMESLTEGLNSGMNKHVKPQLRSFTSEIASLTASNWNSGVGASASIDTTTAVDSRAFHFHTHNPEPVRSVDIAARQMELATMML